MGKEKKQNRMVSFSRLLSVQYARLDCRSFLAHTDVHDAMLAIIVRLGIA